VSVIIFIITKSDSAPITNRRERKVHRDTQRRIFTKF